MKNILELINKYKYGLVWIVVSVIIIIGSIFFINNNRKIDNNQNNNLVEEMNLEENSLESLIESITIDIKGEVINPGVYELNKGSRVIDAIEISGGLTSKADTSNINLSKILNDENVIIINSKEITQVVKYIEKECNCPSISDVCIDSKDIITNESTQVSKSNSKISINTATKEELMNLNGIGESKAKDIINYRNENGLFKNIEDIKNVSGIGDKLFEKIKEQITV